jgi:hypothetical protein
MQIILLGNQSITTALIKRLFPAGIFSATGGEQAQSIQFNPKILGNQISTKALPLV